MFSLPCQTIFQLWVHCNSIHSEISCTRTDKLTYLHSRLLTDCLPVWRTAHKLFTEGRTAHKLFTEGEDWTQTAYLSGRLHTNITCVEDCTQFTWVEDCTQTAYLCGRLHTNCLSVWKTAHKLYLCGGLHTNCLSVWRIAHKLLICVEDCTQTAYLCGGLHTNCLPVWRTADWCRQTPGEFLGITDPAFLGGKDGGAFLGTAVSTLHGLVFEWNISTATHCKRIDRVSTLVVVVVVVVVAQPNCLPTLVCMSQA